MLRRNMVERTNKPAFQDREKSFDSICCNVPACILTSGMIDRRMTSKVTPNAAVDASIIRHKVRVFSNVAMQDGFKRLTVDRCDVKSANTAITLNKRNNLLFGHIEIRL